MTRTDENKTLSTHHHIITLVLGSLKPFFSFLLFNILVSLPV